ncbi:TetR/AcrR family transcriptional regulator C-terminal domain-containing protein, partial [Frankia tisae]|uniref:TetR/AcrR family transcriptional regulator C-terminal domain-containing protein n=1 Tax=Frankia tisae TaxID=2950104 RepID=UPI0027E23E96
MLHVADPALAARQFFALINAQIPELTENGTRPVADDVVRRAVQAGVRTFLLAQGVPAPQPPAP